MKIFNAGATRWESTRDTREDLLGFDQDVIEDPDYLDFVDKEEEYDLIHLGR